MGGLFSPKMPKPLPLPARPVTAVTKTPDIEFADAGLAGEMLGKKKRGKRALRTELLDRMSAQVSSAASGLQIPNSGQ